MSYEEGHLPEGISGFRNSRLAVRMAMRASGMKSRSARVVLALPGVGRYPFESGLIADMIRRAALLGSVVSSDSEVEPCIYTSRLHRLPELRLPQAEKWITDWGVIPHEPLLPQDAKPPSNLLTQHVESFSLFGPQNVGGAMREIAGTVSAEAEPTLVLFFVWGFLSDEKALAGQLDRTSGENVFWQFFGESSTGLSVLDRLDALRSEAPHIRNVSMYRGWDSIDDTPEYLFYRGVTKPFARWRKDVLRRRTG
ncbi:VWA domain-containing protein [Streptomyces sp. NPDC056831]|uniref:VWA domain-containing protein n=1 Tax=Streptomyces sp. NPDC056831 TaxID=3345954 RepID=UPI0036A884EB